MHIAFFRQIKIEYYIYIYLVLTSLLTLAVGRDVLILCNLMIIFGIVSFILLKNRKFLLIFTIFISLFYTGIPNGNYVVIYAYLLMLLTLLMHYKKIQLDKLTFMAVIITLFLNLAPLLVNGTSLALLIFSIFKKFGFLIIYMFVLNMVNISEKYQKGLMKFILIALVINFFAAVVQFKVGGLSQDFITGLLGGGMTGIFMYLLMFFIAIASGLHYKKHISTIYYLTLVTIPVIYAAIAEVKIGFVTTTIMLVVYLGIINKSYKSLIYLTISGIILIQLYSLFISIYPNHSFLDKDFLESYLVEQSYGDKGTINRFDFKHTIDTMIFTSETESLFGKGLGSGNPSEVDILKGNLYDQYDYLKFRWFTLPYLYVESGIVGTILYIGIYTIPLIIALKYFIKKKTSLSVMILLMSLTNLLYLPYNSGLLTHGVTTVFWVFVGMLVKEVKKIESSTNY